MPPFPQLVPCLLSLAICTQLQHRHRLAPFPLVISVSASSVPCLPLVQGEGTTEGDDVSLCRKPNKQIKGLSRPVTVTRLTLTQM